MKNKTSVGISFALIALLGAGLVAAFPFGEVRGNSIELTDAEAVLIRERHEAIRTAVENQDYGAWKSLMEDRIAEMQAQLSEENFNSLVERHEQRVEFREAMIEARETGDFTKVEELAETNGFSRGNGLGRYHRGFGFDKDVAL